MTRYQSSGRSLIFSEVDFGAVVEKAVKKVSPLAGEKEIEMRSEVKSQKATANEESLEEMLLIFLDNAVKYTPSGGRVTVEGELNRGSYVIKVKDTGVGIAKKDLPHIFDRFYRADQSRSKNKVAGFGLGLFLAKQIIEIHKGAVEVASVLGKGATFTIKLPFKQV